MRKRYKRICFREEVVREFQRRAKALGMTYSDFLKRLLAENEMRKAKELREFFSLLSDINEKLDLVLINLPSISPIQEKKQSNHTHSDLKVIIEVLKAFGEKYILLPQRKKEFLDFVKDLEKQEISLLTILEIFQKFVELTFVNPSERKDLESKLEELKKAI